MPDKTTPQTSANLLTPIDRLFSAASIRCQIAFSSNDASQCYDVMRKGLEQLLVELPFLSQQLIIPPGCDSMDSIKIEACPSLAVERILKLKSHEKTLREAITECNENKAQFERDFMPIAMVPDMEQPMPVLIFQANLHPDGLLLVVAANHMVIDATGMGVAIENLANCCRRLDEKDFKLSTSSVEQDQGREMLMHQLPAKNPGQAFPEYRIAKNLFTQWKEMAKYTNLASSSLQPRYLNIRAEDVQELKDCCNKMLPDMLAPEDKADCDGVPWVSSSDVVVALIWSSLNLARASISQTNVESRAGIAVNIRSRVSPALPKKYMGNAAILMLVESCKEAAACPDRMEALCRVAYTIRKGLALKDSDYVRALLHHVQNAEDPVVFGFEVANFYVTNWREMDCCSADFGSVIGKPQHSRASDSPADGTVYIMPKRAHVDNAPWEIQVSFAAETLKRLEQDSLWTRYMHADPFWS